MDPTLTMRCHVCDFCSVVVFGLFYMKTGFKFCISCFLEIRGTVCFMLAFRTRGV